MQVSITSFLHAPLPHSMPLNTFIESVSFNPQILVTFTLALSPILSFYPKLNCDLYQGLPGPFDAESCMEIKVSHLK